MNKNFNFFRVFSKSLYKTSGFPLGEMTFTKDFINDNRGDLYPIIQKELNCSELISNNSYNVKDGCVERLFTRFFPYATYKIKFINHNGSCGFAFHLPDAKATIICTERTLCFSDGKLCEEVELGDVAASTMIVSCRPGAFDVYFAENSQPIFFHTFKSEVFSASNQHSLFKSAFVSLFVNGSVTVCDVSSYIDCGISQADIRAVCYENSEPIYENGKIYFTASIRMQEGGFQGIFSWIPSTSKIELTGALFFDCGDGFWRNYLASSLIYNRKTNEWYIWTSSFEHKHILCYASFVGEPRFGVNVIDVKMMKSADTNDVTAFMGFQGDEDPDFYYNEQEKMWYMAICRLSPSTKRYGYVFFKSKNPFSDYTYVGQGYDGTETGGSFVNISGEIAFVCGNSFDKRANYRIYTKDGMTEATFNFDDGGFRGWGTIIPVTMGSRKRYFWLTFDRHNGSSYNWSYGNIYCFEADT